MDGLGQAMAAGNNARDEGWLRRSGSPMVVSGVAVLREKKSLVLYARRAAVHRG